MLEKETGFALGRNRNVVISGVHEPHMREGKQRFQFMSHYLSTFSRMADLPGHISIKRVLRLGRWQRPTTLAFHKPRPIVVEFGNPRNRDHFLAAAEKIRSLTNGVITVTPDDRKLTQYSASKNSRNIV